MSNEELVQIISRLADQVAVIRSVIKDDQLKANRRIAANESLLLQTRGDLAETKQRHAAALEASARDRASLRLRMWLLYAALVFVIALVLILAIMGFNA